MEYNLKMKGGEKEQMRMMAKVTRYRDFLSLAKIEFEIRQNLGQTSLCLFVFIDLLRFYQRCREIRKIGASPAR